MSHTEKMYGLFPGGDPRKFKPSVEECTPAELEAHAQACREWDEGRGVDRGPGCAMFGDGSAHDGTGFGIGVYEFEMPEEWEYEAESAEEGKA